MSTPIPGPGQSAPTPGFAARVRASTRAAHEDAEGTSFLADLLGGHLGSAAHAAMLAQMHPIYSALEATGRALAGDPSVAPFLDPRLVRLASLESDLAHLLGDDWRDALSPSPATAEYVERLVGCTRWPVGFVVHHYLRYLGDLSGGQAVATLLAREYGLGPAALSFYAFDVSPAPYRTHYRGLLDAAPWSTVEQDAFIAEAEFGYRINRDVLDDLGALWCPQQASPVPQVSQ